MTSSHKNKTLATFLATTLGGVGLHRFYLWGKNDLPGWLHFLTVLPVLFGAVLLPTLPQFALASLFFISILIGWIEALVIGLTADEKWDATHNRDSSYQSQSGWPLAILLVLTFGVGAIAVIATIARAFDLFFTGGAYG
ncbi:MAG TPA: NINE protein [Noviherbaspirillum sp.]|nr:NINE protein [Noviherbaspirillum sp.]